METFPWSPKSDAPVRAHLALVQLCSALARPRPLSRRGFNPATRSTPGEPEYAEEVLELTHELVQRATDAAGARVDERGEEDGGGRVEWATATAARGAGKAKAEATVAGDRRRERLLGWRARISACANVLARCCRPTARILRWWRRSRGARGDALGAEDAYQRHRGRTVARLR